MKIYLYLHDKILIFTLPRKVLGSYSFDGNPEEEAKLINIEARDGEWILYSTEESAVMENGLQQGSVTLKVNVFYTLKKNNKEYLIYVTELFDNSFSAYTFKEDLNIMIGNDPSCNLNFNCSFIKGQCVNLVVREGKLVLNKLSDCKIFVNNNLVTEQERILNFGDSINIYGLKLMLMANTVLINNPMNKVNLNAMACRLNFIKVFNNEDIKDLEVKDSELYHKEQYFSKAPRLRRIITTKEIDLSPPPKQNGEQEMPLILTIGPMMTMGSISLIMFVNTISKIQSGLTTFGQAWPQLASSGAMLLSMLVWPSLTRLFNKRLKEKKKEELIERYTEYLSKKEQELVQEEKLQREILVENLFDAQSCLPIIKTGKINFWDKRIDQNDFLEVRLGIGNALLNVKVNYPEEGFTIEEDALREKADALVEKYKYIENVPVGYSLFDNKITAFMGNMYKCYGILNNIILQLITFYSYDDIKLVILTSKANEDKWDCIKYLNHCFSNDKSFRFFSTNYDSAKRVCDYLNVEFQSRLQLISEGASLFKPHYIIIADDYDSVKRHNFIKAMTEVDANLGYSLVILGNSMSKLPSKCNNFINMGDGNSSILKNSFEKQEIINFKDEINYNINMMEVVRKLSNIPIEFQEGNKQLPDMVTFLEMEKVGKVEQLNVLNRWETNDSTASLRAEVGVDEDGKLMYLDLHEKFHGPHGLIAGMTGSGKSEFIITYILSMAVNYSPDDVAFILIDYKGGGLAFAFENKTTGVSLPHLAGTITNLDKAEMDRTLVSIDSEIKRRQKIFNEARDLLGESTIDIYKYQRYYKDGKLAEAIPHLFIICDEFAELKSQQPDFMDNLISVARIGRSLGVHLILATQKPSGVVNDQIWSNTKFRVCLKVQDASDSKEMLKRPDAASLKQTGRFYLQVGYDEYFALGQSSWCGAKYYPSEKIIKQVDKSLNFIDDTGNFIKSIQAGNNIKIEAQGEQLSAIMNNIIEASKITGKKAMRLWLNDIDPVILVDNLIKKYDVKPVPYEVKAILGEYDAPEAQEQGLLEYSYRENGNTVIFGNDEAERESLLYSMIYSTCVMHSPSEVNIYMIDYGSESLRVFEEFPQVGGMVYLGEDDKFKNLFKLITAEIRKRKKMFIKYGGSLINYNAKNETKVPYVLFVLNNYDAILEIYNDIYEDIASIGRDCERYGINILLTCNAPSVIGRRIGQVLPNRYALHLTDPSDYYSAFNMKCNIKPREIFARGLVNNSGIHEFQTASIVDLEHNLVERVEEVASILKEKFKVVVPGIPTLPEKVTMDIVESEISSIQKVPIGVSKDSLKVIKYDFTSSVSTIVASNRLERLSSFVDSLVDVYEKIPNVVTFFVDFAQALPSIKEKTRTKYFNSNFDILMEQFINFEKNQNTNKAYNIIYIFYGVAKVKNKLSSMDKLEELCGIIKQSENSNIILVDSSKNLKSLDLDRWYSSIKNNTDGIWIGGGFGEQQNFRLSKITKEHGLNYANNFGFCVRESSAELMKVLEFRDLVSQEEEDE